MGDSAPVDQMLLEEHVTCVQQGLMNSHLWVAEVRQCITIAILHLKCCFDLIDCACDSTGSTSEFCSINGECSCLLGVTGRDCSQCAVGYNLVAGAGCSDCGCSLNGSVSSQCNETGLCECMAGVGGDNCIYTQCLSNRYDYPNCR